MFSIRQDLEEKRLKAIKDLCGEDLEKLFIRFTNVIYFKCEPLDIIAKRTVIITVTKNFDCKVKVALHSKFKEEEMISVSGLFENINVDTMKKVLIYILKRENLKYEIYSSSNNVKITFEI